MIANVLMDAYYYLLYARYYRENETTACAE